MIKRSEFPKFGVPTFKPRPNCEVPQGFGMGTGATSSRAAIIRVSDTNNGAVTSAKIFYVSADMHGAVTLSLCCCMDHGIVGKDFPKMGSAQAAEMRLQEAENRRIEAEELSQRRLQKLIKVTQEKEALEEKHCEIKKLVEKK